MKRWVDIDEFAARLLMVSFFLPSKVQMFAAIGSCSYFFLRTMALKQWAPRKNYFQALILGSSFLLYLLAVPFTPAVFRKDVLHICERRESFLLIPFLFAIITPQFRELIRDRLIYFVYACFIAATIANVDFFYHYAMGHDGTHPLSHILYRMYFEAVCGLHPTYMSLYLVFSICILSASSLFELGRAQFLKNVAIYAMLAYLLALLAKSPLIAFFLIVGHAAYQHRKSLARYRYHAIGGFAVILSAVFFIPFFRQRIAEMSQLFVGTSSAKAEFNSVYVRKLIWMVDTDIIKAHWLMGVGPGSLLHMLHARYFFYSIAQSFPIGYYDPHNEYFSVWLSFGIFGLLLFVGILMAQFVRALNNRDYLYLYLLIVLSVTFFTETVLARQQGILFYAVFTSACFFCPKPTGGSPIASAPSL